MDLNEANFKHIKMARTFKQVGQIGSNQVEVTGNQARIYNRVTRRWTLCPTRQLTQLFNGSEELGHYWINTKGTMIRTVRPFREVLREVYA